MAYLSDESFELLKTLENGSDNLSPHTFDNSCIDQLLENGFIDYRVDDYDYSGSDIFAKYSDYFVTEKGKGYIAYRKYDEEFHFSVKDMADSAKKVAESSKIQAELAIENANQAKKEAGKAKRKSIISIVISVISPLISAGIAFLAAADQIYLNIQKILSHLGF